MAGINTNLSALNTSRNLSSSQVAQSQAVQRLLCSGMNRSTSISRQA